MSGVTIHTMTPFDVEEVYAIEKLCFQTPWSLESLKHEIEDNIIARYLVAKMDGRVVGYGGMWIIGDEGHITNVAVHPDFRAMGIGDKLVSSLIQRAKMEKVTSMTLEVRKSNTPAQNLYIKHGFRSAGIRPKYYGDNNEDAVIMWKTDL